MSQYVALLRGINVGGNNKVPMAELKTCVEALGFTHVETYINSGNILFDTASSPQTAASQIERALAGNFHLTAGPVKVLVVSQKQLTGIVADAPDGFGQEPDACHYGVIFCIDTTVSAAMEQLETHPEVDTAWPGDGVIYYRRRNARLTASRMGKIAGKPAYKSITIRNWNTTTKLLTLLEARA